MLPYQSSEGSLLLQEKDLPSLATSGVLVPILCLQSPQSTYGVFATISLDGLSPVPSAWVCGLCVLTYTGILELVSRPVNSKHPLCLHDLADRTSAVPRPLPRLLTLCSLVRSLFSAHRSDCTSGFSVSSPRAGSVLCPFLVAVSSC